jgi:hypothetical protein
MTAFISPPPRLQFFTNAGVPMASGLLYTYAAGTTTPLVTYTDSSGLVANTNPVILDSRGEASIWLGGVGYKFKLATPANVDIWTQDNIAPGSSAYMSYTPAGTGAVTTTVQAKLRESVSVKDFGAVGDGVTDDTAAIQACIDAVAAVSLTGVGSKIVFFPKGTYKITTTLLVAGSDIILQGEGIVSSLIVNDSASATAIKFAFNPEATRMYGNGIERIRVMVSASLDSNATGIEVIHCDHFRMQDCIVENHLINLLVNGCTVGSVTNCTFFTGQYFAASPKVGSRSVVLKNYLPATDQIANFKFIGCTIAGFIDFATRDPKCEYALLIDSCDTIFFDSCLFQSSQRLIQLLSSRVASGIYSVFFGNCFADGNLGGSPQIPTASYLLAISDCAASVGITDITWSGGGWSAARVDGALINQTGINSLSFLPNTVANIGRWAVNSLTVPTIAFSIGGVMRNVAQNAPTPADGGGVYVASGGAVCNLSLNKISVSGLDYGASVNGSPGVSGNLGTGLWLNNYSGQYSLEGYQVKNCAVENSFNVNAAATITKFGCAPISFPAGAFQSTGGTTIGTVGGGRRTAWLLDAAVSEFVATAFYVPTYFSKRLKCTIIWTNAGAGAGNVVYAVSHAVISNGETLNQVDAGGAPFTLAAPLQDIQVNSIVPVNMAVEPGEMLYVRVGRTGGDAADTLANDVAFLEMILEPL